MDNLQPYKISLDFYIRKIITVNAKQLDSDSRVINITCTENGKKFFVDSSTTSAFVRYKKSDGNAVLSQVDILTDGTVNLELSQQMLAVEGRHLVDIMLINSSEEIDIMKIEDIINSKNLEGVSVLSTMTFYINVESTAIDHSEIESSHEYDALIKSLVGTDEAINRANTQANNAEKWAGEAEKWAGEAEEATEYANTQGDYAKEQGAEAYNQSEQAKFQATRAEEAADKIDAIVAGEVVMKDEKGSANGVATLDDSALIPNEQINTRFDIAELREIINSGESLSIILGKIALYMQTINNMSQKYSNTIENLPILSASSPIPTEGDAYEINYNTGVTINPSEKSVNASSFSANEKITVGSAILECEDNDYEKRLVISFI